MVLDRFGRSDTAGILLEMRLGKTLAAVRWAGRRLPSPQARVLVVAPTTPLVSWQSTLDEEGEGWTLAVGSARAREDAVARERWTLSTYAVFWRTPRLLSRPWDGVILDESTAVKNPKAKCTKAAFRFLVRARCRAILTGEVEPQGLFDVWCQMAWLGGGSWMGFSNYWKWRDAVGYRAGFAWEVKPKWKSRIKEAVHRDALVLTRGALGVGSRRVREARSRELDPAAARAYRRVVRDWASGGRETKHAIVVSSWLRQIVGGHAPGADLPCWKVEEVSSLLRGELAREQVIVWFVFNRELVRVWRRLKDDGVSITWLTGRIGLDDRRKRLDLFRRGRRRVVLAQIKCAMMGVDMSAADTEVYYSSPWSYEERRQSEDRVESPTKRTTTLAIDLISKGTVDEDVQDATKERHTTSAWFSQRALTRAEERWI